MSYKRLKIICLGSFSQGRDLPAALGRGAVESGTRADGAVERDPHFSPFRSAGPVNIFA
jgi:hypothetical protein